MSDTLPRKRMNTAEMAKRVLSEADTAKRDWQRDVGMLSRSIRVDVPLQQSQQVLNALRWLADELPAICLRIEREKDEERRLLVAQDELQRVRAKIGRKRKARN